MLYPNGQRVLCYPGRHMAGALAASGAMAYGGLQGARLNRYVSGTYSKVLGAVPSGYSGNAYVLAIKSGGLAGFSGLAVTGTAAGVLGLPGSGDASITFTVADATGQLISSGSGSASITFTVADALLIASLSGSGGSTFSITTNTPLLGAIANLEASGSFSITGTAVPYAIGSMSGTTVDTTTLTAAALIAAMNASPPAVNIKKVNDYDVTGNGQTGSEWGPS